MARDSGFGIQELLKTYVPRFVEVLERINKNLELMVERLPEPDGKKDKHKKMDEKASK